MRIVRTAILFTTIICIALFSEKETGNLLIAPFAASSTQDWSQADSPVTVASPKNVQYKVPVFHSYADLPDSRIGSRYQLERSLLGNREISPTAKVVALTFDDGPHPEVTTEILNILDRYNAKATFFMVGERVQYYPKTVRDVFARGHEIGNHTWSHSNLTELKEGEVEEEITYTNEAVYRIIGKKPAVFRPPYGSLNDLIRQQIKMKIVLWSADTFDYKSKDADLILEEVSNKVHDKAIILMHDIYPSTADGLESVLQYLQEQGYTFVTVSELFALEQK